MADLTDELIRRIRENRFKNLDLPADLVIPDFGELSVRAIPAGVARLLEAPDFPAPPLASKILQPVAGNVRRVLLILVDALSLTRFKGWLEADPSLVWNHLSQDGVLGALTSVTPSTTSTCLPTIWSGLPPAVHGFVGYELWLKEYGVVANMIKQAPFNVDSPAGSLELAGFKPETALPEPTLGVHLKNAGVRVLAFQHYSIHRSGLSRLLMKGAETVPYSSTTDLWFNLLQAFQRHDERPAFSWVYWGDIDYQSHNYGPDSPRPREAFSEFSRGFRDIFINGLTPEARRETAILLTADHGQISTEPDPFYELSSHPGLERRLHILPTGENRMVYFYIRPGQTEAVREYLERTFPNQFWLIDPDSAILGGLFGPGQPHPGLRDRIGDLVAIALGNAYLWWSRNENIILGRHGGLSEDEMLVPFLAARI